MMFNFNKKAISLGLISVIFTALFAGCGGSSSTPSQSTTQPTATSSVSSEATSSAPTVIKYVSWMTKGEDKPYIEQFNKENPDIRVEDEAIDGSNYDKLLKVRLMSNDAPDVFLIQMPQYAKYVQEGYLKDVTAQDGMSLLDTNESVKNALTVGGKQYGFPINTNGGPIPIYYNKVYFDKLGITTMPQTVEEFYKLCDTIKADGVEPLVFGDQDSWVFEMFFRYRHYSGMLGKYPEWGQALYNGDIQPSDFFEGELKMAQDMFERGYISKASLTLTWPQSVPYFMEGKAAMLPQGPWVPGLDEIKAADPAVFQLACFTSPTDTDATTGKKISTGEVDRMLVTSAQTKNAQAADKFFSWFIGETNLTKYLEEQSLVTFLNLNYKVDPVLTEHYKRISSSEYQLILTQKVSLAPGFITDSCFKSFQNILAGSPAQTELQKMNSEFEKTKAASVVNN